MALLDVLVYPDPRLRQNAQPVERVDEDVKQLVDDMAVTMYAAPGIGLAAVQVNCPLRIIVIDTSEDHSDLQVFINPEIVRSEGQIECEEGCLSVPGIYAPVIRAQRIEVTALNREGKPIETQAEDLLSVCIQHEIDHLNGVVFVDYLSRLKRDRIRKKLEKELRSGRSTRVEPAALRL